MLDQSVTPAEIGDEQASLNTLLVALVKARGSDLHLTVGVPPTIRIDGKLHYLPDYEPLEPTHTALLIKAAASDEQWQEFEQTGEADFAYVVPGLARFRVNLYAQRGSLAGAFRAIPHDIKALDELGAPASVANFAHLPRGLVLVTGPTGSGKTTTLAALIDLANQTRSAHIVTIEDPIEFVHKHKRSLINQREVGADTTSFATALKQALRQDPDIILIGELRDLETTATAVSAAETGHLVLATMHTQSAAQSIARVVDMFPATQQQQIRAQLSTALQGVVAQTLVPRADGSGRTLVSEVMFATPAIRNLIREGKAHQIPSFIQSGYSDGMISFDQHLAERVREQQITVEQALELCHSVPEFKRLTGRG